MSNNKKIIVTALILCLAVIATLSACKGKMAGGTESVVVTDANGVPITDKNGEAMTVMLQTTIVEITNINGEKVYDEDGKVKTSIKYLPQDVGVPVTNENGEFVTNSKGDIETTMITIPPTAGSPVTSNVPLTDSNGEVITDKDGNQITYPIVSSTNPATPGDNNANWGATFGGSGNDEFIDTASLSDGGFISIVKSNSSDGSLKGLVGDNVMPVMVIIKYNKDCQMQWQKVIGGDSGILFSSLCVDSEDNIFAVGYSQSKNLGYTNQGDYDAMIYKFNNKGDVQWLKSFGGKNTDTFESIALAPDGDVVVVGFTNSTDGSAESLSLSKGESTPILLKFSPDGTQKYVKSIGSSGDTLVDVTVAENGDIYAVGNFSSATNKSILKTKGRSDCGIIKLDKDANVKWVQQYGGSDIDSANSITLGIGGGCVIAGKTKSTDGDLQEIGNQGGYDAFITKYNDDGSLGWRNVFRGSFDEEFTEIKLNGNQYTLSGFSLSGNRNFKPLGNRGGTDAFLVNFGETGRPTSVQSYGGNSDDKFKSFCILKSGQTIACGSTLSKDGDLIGSKIQSDGINTVGMIARFK
ncbi:MAG: hypothetical protein RSB11_02410 [Oscillospiraceae bacterium]